MCCSPRFEGYEWEPDGHCPECGEETVDGEAQGCTYSPQACEVCGYSPCDGSC